jgi:hypothetical protein
MFQLVIYTILVLCGGSATFADTMSQNEGEQRWQLQSQPGISEAFADASGHPHHSHRDLPVALPRYQSVLCLNQAVSKLSLSSCARNSCCSNTVNDTLWQVDGHNITISVSAVQHCQQAKVRLRWDASAAASAAIAVAAEFSVFVFGFTSTTSIGEACDDLQSTDCRVIQRQLPLQIMAGEQTEAWGSFVPDHSSKLYGVVIEVGDVVLPKTLYCFNFENCVIPQKKASGDSAPPSCFTAPDLLEAAEFVRVRTEPYLGNLLNSGSPSTCTSALHLSVLRNKLNTPSFRE